MERNEQGLSVLNQLKRLTRYNHTLFVHASFFPFPISAIIRRIDEEAGQLYLFFYLQGQHLLEDGQQVRVGLDLELELDDHEADDLTRFFSTDSVTAEVNRVGEYAWEARCDLSGQAVFATDRRGGVRIPFMHGMTADVVLAFDQFNEIHTPVVRNLSQGGCLLAIPIVDSFAFYVGQHIRTLKIVFPNGDSIITGATVRHIRPFGQARYVNVGFEFLEADSHLQARLTQYVAACQAELAALCGVEHRSEGRIRLFRPSAGRQPVIEKKDTEQEEVPPMAKFLREVALDLNRTAFLIKEDKPFPMELLNDTADQILSLLREDRSGLLYSLSYLLEEAGWVRHSIGVAVRLADTLLDDSRFAGQVRDAVSACLLHAMGKMLALGDQIPTLNTALNQQQKNLLKGHSELLWQYLDRHSFRLSVTTQDIIRNAGERPDGSGYPRGRQGEQVSPLVRTLSVIKIIDVLTHPRNERTALSPVDAYKWVYARSEQYDQEPLLQYIKRFGFFPIGSLARFSAGFLAWIMEQDEHGSPSKVRVTRNLAYPDTHLNTVLNSLDFPQIGRLERVVCPFDYQEVSENGRSGQHH